MDVLNDITKVTVKLLIKEPFYGHFFTYLYRTSDSTIERVTLSLDTTGRIEWKINPDFWNGLSVDQKYGCIKHQILHLVFRHIYKTKEFGNKTLFHLASDIVINQYISSEQREKDAITIERFPFLNLEKGKSVDYYYQKLKKLFTDYNSQPGSETEGEEGNGNENLAHNSAISEHRKWETFDAQKGAQKKFVEEKLDTYAKQSADRLSKKDFNLLPASLQTSINDAQERLNPSVNWKRLLRLFMQSSRKTMVKSTLKKPSKRYGTIPGSKIIHKQKVLVVIDTSGSVDNDELNHFFSEVYHIWKNASEITIIECDAKIQRIYSYKGKCPEVVKGGGGTVFDEPIEYANKSKPDVILYFTDGYANAPKVISIKPIIWIISNKGIKEKEWDFLLGRKVKLTK